MVKVRFVALAVAIMLFVSPVEATTISNADFILWQEYSTGPNAVAPATPGWTDYVANVHASASASGIAGGVGDPATPGYFGFAPTIVPLEQVVRTGPDLGNVNNRTFNFWNGQTDPGTAFGAAFANEYGGFLYAPFLLVTTGGPITITSIDREGYSVAENGGGTPVIPGTWTTWSSARVGVTSYGGDGVLGGGDDTYLTSGAIDASPVLAVIATGPGVAMFIERQFDGSPWPVETLDSEIFPTYVQQWNDNFGASYDYWIEYTVNYTTGSPLSLVGDTVYIVPEPTSLAMAASAAGLACVWLRHRRRASRVSRAKRLVSHWA